MSENLSLKDYYNAIQKGPENSPVKAAFEERFIEQYAEVMTKGGYDFATCIHPMLDTNDDMNPRIYDESCLEEFDEFFTKVLECNESTKKSHVHADVDDLNMDIFKQHSELINLIVSVDFEVRRNFSGCLIGESRLSPNTKSLGQSIIGGLIGLKMNGEYLSTLDRERMKNLRRNGLFLGDDKRTVNEIELSIKYPALERGVYFGTENTPSVGTQLIAFVNMNDHLRIVSRDNTFQELSRAYDTVKKSVEKVRYNMNFPFETWDYVMQAVPKMSTAALTKLFTILDDHQKAEIESKKRRRAEREERRERKRLKELEATAAAQEATAPSPDAKEAENQEGKGENKFIDSTEKRASLDSIDADAFEEIIQHNENQQTSLLGSPLHLQSLNTRNSKVVKQLNSSADAAPVEVAAEGENLENAVDAAGEVDAITEKTILAKEEEEEDDTVSSDTPPIVTERFHFAHSRKFGYACHNASDLGGGLCIRFLVRLPLLGNLPNLETVLKDLTTLPFVVLEKQCEEEDTLAYFICRKSHGMRGSKFIEMAFNDLLVVLRMEKEMKAFNRLYFEKDIMAVEPIDYLVQLIQKRYSPDNASYATKYLSPLLSKKYSTAMTPYGGTLSHCIRANAYHPDTKFPRACDPYAYSLFSDFLKPVLLEYNAIESALHRVPDLDPTANYDFPFSNPRVKSFRARLVRNVTGYGFPPTVSDVDRKLIEHKLKYCLSQLKDNFIGRYYSLAEAQENHLTKLEPFMDETDDVMRDAGFYRSWPESRGIFDFFKCPNGTDSTAFVNGEDHMRIISIDKSGHSPGSTLKTVVTILHYLNKVLPDLFVKDKDLGYLTCCPSEAGTGLRLSALVTLKNKLRNDKDLLKQHCVALKLQVRGSKGKYTPIKNDIYEISYKARMGCSEMDMMSNFLDALNKIIAAD